MNLTAIADRHRTLRQGAISLMVAVLLGGLLPLGQLVPGIAPDIALACSDSSSVGGNNAGGSGGCPPGTSSNGTTAKPSSGGASSYWYCSYGNGSWRFPRDTTKDNSPVKSQTSTILKESLPYSGAGVDADYWQAHLDSFAGWFYTTGGGGYYQNSSSFFWQNGIADMLATDLMIEPKNATAPFWTGNPASGSILHLRSELARKQLMDSQVINIRTGPDSTWWNGQNPKKIVGPAAYFDTKTIRYHNFESYTEITLTVPGASTARVWQPGTEPAIKGFLTSDIIKGYVSSRFSGEDLKYFLYQDSKGSVNAKPYVQNALKASYVTGYPYEVMIKRPGDPAFKVWTKAQLGGTSFPVGTLMNVQIALPAHSAIYDSIDAVHAAFLQVIKDQMAVAWDQVLYRSDLSGYGVAGQKGEAWYPAFAYPFFFNGSASRPATKAEANGSIGRIACGADAITFYNMTFTRDRTSSPGCGTAFVNSAGTYNSRVNRPDTCWTWWVKQDIPPPRISQKSWDAAINKTFSPVGLKPSSSAVLVNQTVSIKPTLVPPAAINFNLTDPNLNNAVVQYNLTQLGIAVSLGNTTLKVIRYNSAKADGGYSFSLAFDKTPLAKLQEPYCAAAKSAADLQARCGIVFKYDSVSKRVQPYYRVTVQTWWGGKYYTAARGYCALFSSACSNIDPKYAYRISAWDNVFSPVVRNNNGSIKAPAGWQDFTGSPIYNAGYNPGSSTTAVSMDISVGQAQPQVLP